MRSFAKYFVLVSLGLVLLYLIQGWLLAPQPDAGKLGGPITGLTPTQARKFYEARKLFEHQFTPEEGLGPLFNGQSCYECHGFPGPPGGAGQILGKTSLRRFGDVIKSSQQAYFTHTVTDEFASKFSGHKIVIPPIPPQAKFISMLQAPALYGVGLLNSVSDETIEEIELRQIDFNPNMSGHAQDQVDVLNKRLKCGRFGWKDQQPNLMLMTSEMMHRGLGISSTVNNISAYEMSTVPKELYKFFPAEPNDIGSIMAKLTYFQSLLAPPPPIKSTAATTRGEVIFDKLQCSFCHIPEMRTASKVYVVDPDSPFPSFRNLEIQALENRPVRAYTDLLVHNLGSALADGLPESRTSGSEWRTAPLWGLRLRKYYLHDGRTTSLSDAIKAHGGQAEPAKKAFEALPEKDKEDLLAFLKSL